jgi:putative (di)nucleoside polyphosphate hydrolase
MKPYRAGVCIVVRRRNGRKVLLCHRIGSPKDEGWQFPQGGADPGEDAVSTAKRELLEEIGTNDVEVLRVTRRGYSYDYPSGLKRKSKKRYRGQRLRWVLVRPVSGRMRIRFTHEPAEFDAYVWAGPEDALARVIEFKRRCYRNAMRDLGLLIKG